ncbi:MAG: hypothetical protein AAFQ42_14910 [Pseudomonadota bacterium]
MVSEGPITIVAPTTGGLVWIERIRPRPRLQASYAALRGDFRPLTLSTDYHTFVAGPLAAHGLADTAHELLLSGDIDSGRSWEIPVLIGHLFLANDQAVEAVDAARVMTENEALPASPAQDSNSKRIIWATGSIDPELGPQGADFSVPRKLELSTPTFAAWQQAGHDVTLVAPAGMPDDHASRFGEVAERFGFRHGLPASFADLCAMLDVVPGELFAQTTAKTTAKTKPPDPARATNAETSAPLPDHTADTRHPIMRGAGARRLVLRAVGALGAVAVLAGILSSLNVLGLNGLSPGGSNPGEGASGSSTPAGSDAAATSGDGATSGGPAARLTVMRLGAADRGDCIERIMQTRPMNRTVVPMHAGAYQITNSGGLCGLRFVNQHSRPLDVRVTGGLTTVAIQGNDALFQGLRLSPNAATDLIFSRPVNGLDATLFVDGAPISLAITTPDTTAGAD